MTRFSLLAFALFTSACATDVDGNTEDATDGMRASIEDIGIEGDRKATRGNLRTRDRVMSEYGPLAAQYNCDVIGVVSGHWTRSKRSISAQMIDLKGRLVSKIDASIMSRSRGQEVVVGETFKSTLHGSEYQLRGIADGYVIEADFLSESDRSGEEDYQFFADWTPKGRTGGTLKGVVVDCD